MRQQQRAEGDLLDHVAKMGFLMDREKTDLQRLKEDRNLCAHGGAEPTRQQALAHLSHVLLHLLVKRPLLGKRAVERLLKDLLLESFPKREEEAKTFVVDRYFVCAGDAFFVHLLKALVRAAFEEETREQFRELGRRRILAAILEQLRETREDVFSEQLAPFLAGYLKKLGDEDLLLLSPFLGRVQGMWELMTEADRIRFQVVLEEEGPDAVAEAGGFDAAPAVEELAKPLEKKWKKAVSAYFEAETCSQAERRLEVVLYWPRFAVPFCCCYC